MNAQNHAKKQEEQPAALQTRDSEDHASIQVSETLRHQAVTCTYVRDYAHNSHVPESTSQLCVLMYSYQYCVTVVRVRVITPLERTLSLECLPLLLAESCLKRG